MSKSLTKFFWLGLAGALMSQAHAFSLFGPFGIDDAGARWQVQRVGFVDPEGGGVMNAAAGEEYRWNTPTIIYAVDAAFIDFFGPRGVEEIEKVAQILNDLPRLSTLNVDDYPFTNERINFRAAALGLLDLKSLALTETLLEMGLASPTRYIYCLRNRFQPGPNRFPVFFNLIRRNYETVPAAGGIVLAKESSYINGRLWTYTDIIDADNPPESDVIVSPVDPLDIGRFDPVIGAHAGFSGFSVGSYWTGLTRDDVMALKFIYQAGNWNFEGALPDASAAGFSIVTGGSGGGGGGGPWSIPVPITNAPGATNITGTNANGLIDPVIRFGVDKPTFVRGEYDSILGQFFTPITNTYTESIVTNGAVRSQKVQRVITQPDILYTAGDLQVGAEPGFLPLVFGRFTAAEGSWQNGDGLTRAARRSGPGVIRPPISLGFNNVGFITQETATGSFGNAVQGVSGLPYFVWGAFDGSTNEPVVFLQGGSVSAAQLEQIRLGR